MDLSFFLNGHLRRRCKDEEIHKSGPRNNREMEETTGNASAFQWRSGICHLWAKDQSSPRLVHLSHPRVSCTAVSSYRHCDGVEWHWRPPWWLPLHVAATGWQVGGGRDALANSVRLLTRCISLAVALIAQLYSPSHARREHHTRRQTHTDIRCRANATHNVYILWR